MECSIVGFPRAAIACRASLLLSWIHACLMDLPHLSVVRCPPVGPGVVPVSVLPRNAASGPAQSSRRPPGRAFMETPGRSRSLTSHGPGPSPDRGGRAPCLGGLRIGGQKVFQHPLCSLLGSRGDRVSTSSGLRFLLPVNLGSQGVDLRVFGGPGRPTSPPLLTFLSCRH
ncbi:hypothetical protein NDU88_003314 [Pleurodeles waltl]|uniref:Secreted protein n=1 Tax=Pleurodeles waltl TaxID=8319 RepID=A0AAV7W717_PLEWA|nr:hypothetical protein NDU88_003314 [Pleurodeles waltl]